MELKQMVERFKEKIGDLDQFEEFERIDDIWIYYNSVTGFYNDLYFHIFFKHHNLGSKEIEIAETTDKPKLFMKMIKSIDETANVFIAD